MQNEIKPCPFCGGEALLITLRDGYRRLNQSVVHCSVCDAETKFYPLKKEAIEAWNRRANDE